MNIRAFVRGSNAVVVNKKSHGLHYTPIQQDETLPWDRPNRPVCNSCKYITISFSFVRSVGSPQREPKGRKKEREEKRKKKEKGKGKTTRFVPFLSRCSLPCSSFPEGTRKRRTLVRISKGQYVAQEGQGSSLTLLFLLFRVKSRLNQFSRSRVYRSYTLEDRSTLIASIFDFVSIKYYSIIFFFYSRTKVIYFHSNFLLNWGTKGFMV